ncbi:MAG: serpin family protein [Parachlamydiaceae bacterium]|nr:serpin family protein [Parachlamydiaceae bacterium]
MKKKALLFFLFIVLLSRLQAIESFSETRRQEPSPLTDTDLMVLSNNQFGYRLFTLLKKTDENLIFSPYNLSTALQMVYAGSSEMTQSQLARVLHFSLNPKSLELAAGKLATTLTTHRSGQDDLFLSIANSLWIQEGYPILPAFKESITKNYKGYVKSVNFQTMPEMASKEINEWVKIQTQGKIVDLLETNQLSTTTRLLLVSALYMRGKWQSPFSSSLTRLMPFFPSPSKTLTLPTMSLTASFSYIKENLFSIVELPYASKEVALKVSLYILLPHETFALDSIERQLSSQKLLDLSKRLQKTHLTLSIPKFKITSTLSFKPLLEEMGLTDPFSSRANFSGIDGTQNLQLADVLQKGIISVMENGTEAGIATSGSIEVKSSLSKPPELFTADHPFLFFVADKATGTFLFLGRVVFPM